MANFCNYPQTQEITEVTLPNSMDPNSDDVTIGLWGFKDFVGNELEILAPPYVNVRKGEVKGQVRLYNLSSYHPGRWSLEARTQSGATWDRLTVFVKSPKGTAATGGKYTDNPNEVVTRKTTPTAREVISMLLQAWPQLSENGARTLTSQFMVETGGGRFCFNWNLGNVKSPTTDQPHMYLHGVWECVGSQARAQAQVDSGNGLAHIASADEIRQHGWRCESTVVVFEPPHPASRFLAYDTLAEGAARWVGRHQRIAQNNPDYLANLNSGNTAAVAHTLKQVGYYTAPESDYAVGMTREKAAIDRALGAL